MDPDNGRGVPEGLVPPHGGYRKLKSFQIAQLVYDVTVRFCERFVDRRSRTHDQMVQAARSGVQNIAEGSQASGTSRKMELKLTNVARASLEELRLDFEDFLRQRDLARYPANHPALLRFKERRCATLEEVRDWVAEEVRGVGKGAGGDRGAEGHGRTDEHGRTQTDTDMDGHGRREGGPVREGPCSSVPVRVPGPAPGPAPVPVVPEELVANGALSLLNLACHLLDRQLAAQAAAFEREGGFTERLYRWRRGRRGG